MTSPDETSRDQTTGVWPDACLLGVALIWGINMPIMKTGLEQLDPFVFNALRLIISASCLAAFAWRERRAGVRPGPEISWRQILTYATLIGGLYQVLFLMGMDRTTAGNTGLIMATVPVWTALLASVFIGERLSRLAWGGLTLALGGTVIVALQKGDISTGNEHLMGNIIILLSALAWAGGTVYSRPLLKSISPMRLSASAALCALPVHVLLAMGRYGDSVPALQSVNLWAILLYAGILSSGLSLPMWNFGVRHAGAAHAAAVQNLVPLIAIGAAWIGRGEAATASQIWGGTLILGGLVVMRVGRRIADVPQPEPSMRTAAVTEG